MDVNAATVSALKDFADDSDDDSEHDKLVDAAAEIKNFNDEETKKKQQQAERTIEMGGLEMILQAKQEAKPTAAAPAAEKKKAGGPIVFNTGKGPPVFRKGGTKGGTALNKNEFPDFGDFPTIGGNQQQATAEATGPACDNPHVGSTFMQASASGMKSAARPEEGKKSIAFGGKPMFTNSRKVAKPVAVAVDDETVPDKQNYDFSKMRVAAASARRPREEGEGQEETKQEEGGEAGSPKKEEVQQQERTETRRKFEKAQPIAFDAEAATQVKKIVPAEDDDGFMVVTRDQRAKVQPSRAVNNAWSTQAAGPSKKTGNRFQVEEWGEL